MRKALIVGIDNYPDCPLRGCCNDADKVNELLSRHENGEKNFQTALVKNVKCKGELKRLIEECFNGNSATALFYFSGHGIVDSTGGYLVTPDYSDYNYGVSLHEILTLANKSKCKNKIIILDSCYSGKMGNIDLTDQNTSIIGEGVTILTSSRSDETSTEENGHGLFTSLLLEALSGCAADLTGNVTPGGIYAYIDKALGVWGQRPVFKTNVTEFVSLRRVKPQVDISVIRKLCEYFQESETNLLLDPSFEPTNSPDAPHEVIEPYANQTNVKIFADLQALESVGIVVPVNEKHMYYAALHYGSCKLTALGKQYWRLVKKGII